MSAARIVVDLGFGDAGKGTMVDYLAAECGSDLVVRFNGGPQAAHNVCLPDARHHTFSQFGSATFQPLVRTLLSQHMLVEPFALRNEWSQLARLGVEDAMQRLYIDERALVISPPQIMANRIRERSRGAGAHGTCGMGIGECVGDSLSAPDDALRVGDLFDSGLLRAKLHSALRRKSAELGSAELLTHAQGEERRVFEDDAWIETAIAAYQDMLAKARVVSPAQVRFLIRTAREPVFEGAQGVLLDEELGFHPHTTWSCTTPRNATALLDDCGWDGTREQIGVTRTYSTRHGHGPFPTYRANHHGTIRERHNSSSGWQGDFRSGPLDLVLLRYALEACGNIDRVAVTHLDTLSETGGEVCVGYALEGKRWNALPLDRSAQRAGSTRLTTKLQCAEPIYETWPTEARPFVERLSAHLGVQVGYESKGPTRLEKRRT